MQDFVHLHVHTQYSLLDGQASVSALVDKAMKDGMKGIAVTDHGNMFGIKEFTNYVNKKNSGPKGEIKDLKKRMAGIESGEIACDDKEAELADCRAVDYAILMTTRYKQERYEGRDKREAVTNALKVSIPSIIVSAMGLFSATFGVALYSDVDIISSLCDLMARGAIVSMFAVILFLPAMFMLFDKMICVTSIGFRNKNAEPSNRLKERTA